MVHNLFVYFLLICELLHVLLKFRHILLKTRNTLNKFKRKKNNNQKKKYSKMSSYLSPFRTLGRFSLSPGTFRTTFGGLELNIYY